MSKKTEIRNKNKALVAYKMFNSGCTTNHICEQINVKPHQVKSMVLLGERLESLKETQNDC